MQPHWPKLARLAQKTLHQIFSYFFFFVCAGMRACCVCVCARAWLCSLTVHSFKNVVVYYVSEGIHFQTILMAYAILVFLDQNVIFSCRSEYVTFALMHSSGTNNAWMTCTCPNPRLMCTIWNVKWMFFYHMPEDMFCLTKLSIIEEKDTIFKQMAKWICILSENESILKWMNCFHRHGMQKSKNVDLVKKMVEDVRITSSLLKSKSDRQNLCTS